MTNITRHRGALMQTPSVVVALMVALGVAVGRGGAQDTAARPRPADTTRVRGADSSAAAVLAARLDTMRKHQLPPSRTGPVHSRGTRTAAERATAPLVWPVTAPEPLPGSVLPQKRIVAFYGNPFSKKMGVLGALSPDSMLARLDREVAEWSRADPATPVQPALQLITVVAQGSPGRDGKYRLRMPDTLIERVASWAARRDALVFLDVQVGRSTLREELPRLRSWLERPNVHLAIDPEFSMKGDDAPGARIGTMDAADVNYAVSFLADLVTAESLPPKVLVIHRFTRGMLTKARSIRLDPRVQIVIDMDGWGPPSLKRESYRAYVYRYPVEYTGFKLFYHNDTKRGTRLMTPAEVLALFPKPLYIQYQ